MILGAIFIFIQIPRAAKHARGEHNEFLWSYGLGKLIGQDHAPIVVQLRALDQQFITHGLNETESVLT